MRCGRASASPRPGNTTSSPQSNSTTFSMPHPDESEAAQTSLHGRTGALINNTHARLQDLRTEPDDAPLSHFLIPSGTQKRAPGWALCIRITVTRSRCCRIKILRVKWKPRIGRGVWLSVTRVPGFAAVAPGVLRHNGHVKSLRRPLLGAPRPEEVRVAVVSVLEGGKRPHPITCRVPA